MRHTTTRSNENRDERDARHWEAVEEAAETLGQGDYQAGLLELREIIKKDAQNPYAFNLLGTALFELEMFEPARDAYRAATLASPDYLGARVNLSHVLRRLRDFEGAEKEARAAIARHPGDGEAMHALGLALASRGKRREAAKSLQGFLATQPEFEAATEVRGVLEMLGLGEDDEPLEIE